jgi:hypothetical protein
MIDVTLADIAKWDPDALRDVFAQCNTHSLALQGVGADVGDMHRNLTGWHGASGAAARAALGAVRHDVNFYGDELQSVADAVNTAIADIADVKQRYQDIVDTCTRWKLTLLPNGVINDTNPAPDLQRLLVLRREQAAVLDMMRSAARTDDELAAAIHAAISTNRPQAPIVE